MTTGASPVVLTRHSRPARPNPIVRLSGDQNGLIAPSVPLSSRNDTPARSRTRSGPPDATTAIDPSGEIAAKLGLSAGNVNRTSRAGAPVSTPGLIRPIATPATSAAAIASPHTHQRRAVDDAGPTADTGASALASSLMSPTSRRRLFGSQ